MTIAALHKAIQSIWLSSGLEDLHIAYGGVAPTLHDSEATPSQAFPYTVFTQDALTITSRMTGHTSAEHHRLEDVPWNFRVHASQTVASSAKQIAAAIATEIMNIFGGGELQKETPLILDVGSHLLTQFQTSYGIKEDDEEYLWVVSYIFKLDVPFAV
jgi:hypothetical protein